MSIEDEKYIVDGGTRGLGIMGAGMLGAVVGGAAESQLSTHLQTSEGSFVLAGAALGLVGATAYNVLDIIELNHPGVLKKTASEVRKIITYPFYGAAIAGWTDFTLSNWQESDPKIIAGGAALGLGYYVSGKISKAIKR